MEQHREKRGVIAAIVGGAIVFVGGLVVAAWFVAGSGGAAADLAGSAVPGPAAVQGSYEPTSEWVEEGLDPDVTQFGFEAGAAQARSDDAPAIESTGGAVLSEVALHNMMIAKQSQMMPCYVDALNQDPDAAGKVDMKFGIAPDGHVAMVKVTGSTLRHKPMEDCLVDASRSWSFPATGRGTLMKFETDFTFVTE